MKKKSDEEPPKIQPPDGLRCRRNDGKKWRCSHWRIHKQSYCELHYLQSKAKSFHLKNSTKGKRTKPHSHASNSKSKSKFNSRESENDEEEEEEEVIPQKKNRSVSGTKSHPHANEGVLRKNSKRVLEDSDKEVVVPKKRRKLYDENGTGSGRKSDKEKKKKNAKVEEGVVVLDRKERSREMIKRMLLDLECDDDDDEEQLRVRKSSSSSYKSNNNGKGSSSVSQSQMCHQCQKSDRRVIRCHKCPNRRFCLPCIQRWYHFNITLLSFLFV